MRSNALHNKPAPPRVPHPESLRGLYRELMGFPNVQGCYIGHRYKEGRGTRQLAIVCCVTRKVKPGELERAARLPRTVQWQVNSRVRRRITVDVVEMLESGFHAVVGPGDIVQPGTTSAGTGLEPTGTVGIALLHPRFGRVVTTAGHVAQPGGAGISIFEGDQRPQVQLTINTGVPGATPQQVRGFVVKVNRSAGEDYALVQPEDSGTAGNLYHDDIPIARPYSPDEHDLNTPLFVLTRSSVQRAVVKGVNLTVIIQGRRIEGALLTEKRTVGGDSGCCVVDNTSRVWGLLVGFGTFVGPGECSVFTPAHHVARVENATFL